MHVIRIGQMISTQENQMSFSEQFYALAEHLRQFEGLTYFTRP